MASAQPVNQRLVAAISGVALAMSIGSAQAAEPLRYGVLDSMSYPLVVRDDKGMVTGGLLSDLGRAVAREMGTTLRQVPQSRRRMEAAVQSGQVDFTCYVSPQWLDEPHAVQWSVESLLQVERIVTLRGRMMPALTLEELEGKRVATQLGYRYPGLDAWFNSGKVKRVDETRVPLLFKSLEVGTSDALVTSEDEIEGFYFTQPSAREKFEVSAYVVSKVATQCAVSKHSRYPLTAYDKALSALIKRGEIGRMAAAYRLSAR